MGNTPAGLEGLCFECRSGLPCDWKEPWQPVSLGAFSVGRAPVLPLANVPTVVVLYAMLPRCWCGLCSAACTCSLHQGRAISLCPRHPPSGLPPGPPPPPPLNPSTNSPTIPPSAPIQSIPPPNPHSTPLLPQQVLAGMAGKVQDAIQHNKRIFEQRMRSEVGGGGTPG